MDSLDKYLSERRNLLEEYGEIWPEDAARLLAIIEAQAKVVDAVREHADWGPGFLRGALAGYDARVKEVLSDE